MWNYTNGPTFLMMRSNFANSVLGRQTRSANLHWKFHYWAIEIL